MLSTLFRILIIVQSSVKITLDESTPSLADGICYSTYQYLRLMRSTSSITKLLDRTEVPLDDLSVDDLYFSQNEKLSSIITLKKGVLVISNIGQLYYFKFLKEYNFQFITLIKKENLTEQMNLTNRQENFKLIYDPFQDGVYAISLFSSHFFKIDEDLIDMNADIQLKQDYQMKINDWNYSNIDELIISNGLLFVNLIENGIAIYKIEKVCQFEYLWTLDTKQIYPYKSQAYIQIRDLKVGGDRNQFLYVLDYKLGLQQFEIVQSKENVTLILNEELGLIAIDNGIAFDIYNNKTLMVVTEYQAHSLIVEYYLDGNNWLEVNRRTSKGKIKNVAIGPQFAIVQGQNEHIIVYHSMYKQYLSPDYEYNQIYNYIYIPHLNQLQIQSGGSDGENFILALNDEDIFIYPYTPVPPSIWCNTFFKVDDSLVNKELRFILKYNTTDCSEKKKFGHTTPLQQCIITEKFTVIIQKALITSGHFSYILIAAVVVISILFLIIFGLICLWRGHSIKIGKIQDQIRQVDERVASASKSKDVEMT